MQIFLVKQRQRFWTREKLSCIRIKELMPDKLDLMALVFGED
jgi:hypothetical protein